MPYTYPESFKDFTRGGQTTLHNLRMVMQIIKKIILVFLIVTIIYNIVWWIEGIQSHHYSLSAAMALLNAKVRLWLGHSTDPIQLESLHGITYSLFPQEVIQNPSVLSELKKIIEYLKEGLFYSLMASLSFCGLVCSLLWGIGKKQRKTNVVRGLALVDNQALKKRITKIKICIGNRSGGYSYYKGFRKDPFFDFRHPRHW